MRFQQRQRLRQRPDDLGAIIDFEWLLKGIQRTLVITDGSSEKLLHGRPAVVPSSVDTLTTRPVERVLAIFPPRFDQAGADCGLSQPAAPLQQTEDIHRFLQLTAKRTIDERGAINPSGWRLRNPAACWVSFSTLSLVSARCRDEADITTDSIAVTDSRGPRHRSWPSAPCCAPVSCPLFCPVFCPLS